MQNYLNLLYREEEREMLPLCREEGIGVIPWSPLAKYRLTRDWNEQTARSEIDEVGKAFYAKMAEADRKVVEVVAEIAAKRGFQVHKLRLLGFCKKASNIAYHWCYQTESSGGRRCSVISDAGAK